MDSSKIEVGDVFTLREERTFREYICTNSTEHFVDAKDGAFARERCRLVRKADPYHGITLPEPPAGYRLAKWGEELPTGTKWFHSCTKQWLSYERFSRPFNTDCPETAIFAIPLNQPSVSDEFRKAADIEANTPINSPVPSPLKTWQFREVPWVVPQPETLADCVEGIDVVCNNTLGIKAICRRIGKHAWNVTSGGVQHHELFPAEGYEFVRYLDSPPQKPMSLDDVPDGRVVDDHDRKYWTDGRTWWRVTEEGGVFKNVTPPKRFTITNYIAEFRGPA